MKPLLSKKAVIQKAFLKNSERQIRTTLLYEAKGYSGSKQQIYQEPERKSGERFFEELGY